MPDPTSAPPWRALRQFDDPGALKLVAIDDGSRDETGAHMRHYAERFGHAQLITNPEPIGLASARNQGLAHVEGDFFCFVDGDDWMQPLRLADPGRRRARARLATSCARTTWPSRGAAGRS
ncbi:glycosyltransferase family 2 protein [Microbacterium elymi]|uniref:Glycosyltransferase n=1 Tax=Microbacterium elymi TaxID=2909587 RepID=A0ABY5NMI6_9MICO|nr:glycosyltransferase family 2 protein [Microbacterium elymi]UUT36309.1 glycosyltransferase [Microbacterium elymi]